MQDAIPVTELEPAKRHRHPALHVRTMKDERPILDDSFQICVEVFQHEVQTLSRCKDVQ
jgi:hypothetical protein